MDKGLIFTYGMTAVGAVGGLVSPFFGLLVYVCFAIVRPDYMWFWSVPQGNYSRIIAVAMLASTERVLASVIGARRPSVSKSRCSVSTTSCAGISHSTSP